MSEGIEQGTLIGRVREIARLQAAFEGLDATPPAGRTIVIGGEAGIGKTRLVAALVETARERGAAVLVGACLPSPTGSVPYAPFVEALRGLTRSTEPGRLAGLLGPARDEIGRLFPEIARPAAAPGGRAMPPRPDASEADRSGQGRLFEAILTVLERLGRDAPIVLVIEDVQWADVGTRSLITFLSRNLREQPTLMLLTVRTDDADPIGPTVRLLAELERQPWVDRIELGPLGRSEVARLLRGISGDRMSTAPVTDDVMARSGGNPFFVEQLAAAATSDHGDRRLPPGLRDVLIGRLGALPEPTRQVLRGAAAAGRRVDEELLAEVLGLSVPAVADALRPAVAHGVLVDAGPVGGGYAFHHALLAEVAYGELLHGERDRLHAGFGLELERRGEVGGMPVTPAEVAHHWVAARDRDRAIPALLRAGQAAEAVFAFAEAGVHYERALALIGTRDDPPGTSIDRSEVLQRAAECAVLTGSYARAIELGQQAIIAAELAGIADGHADPIRLGLLHDRLRWFLWESGDRVAADAAVTEALRLIPGDPPSAARARALGQAAGLRLFGGEAVVARAMATEAVEVARAARAASEEAFGLGVLGWSEALTGEVDRGIDTYRGGLAIAERLGGAEGIALGHANLAALLDRVGRTEASLAAGREGYAIAQRLGVVRTYGGGLLGHVAKALFDLGRWDEAAAAADEGLELDPVGGAAVWLHINRARVDTNQGRFEDAADHLHRAQALMTGGTGHDRYRAPLWAASAELAAWRHDLTTVRAITATAHQGVDRTAPLDPAIGWLGWHALRAEADAAVAARASQDSAAIREVDRQVAPIADLLDSVGEAAVGDTRRTALAGMCRGELDRIRATADADVWDRTAAAWDEAGRPAPAAYARFRSADARITSRGDRAAAVALLRDAHAAAHELRAIPLRTEIERLARHARIDLARIEDVAGDAAEDRLGLTEREAEVIRHVAAGRSNQQIADALFITRKTASVHVSNILGKLGVANRVEAAAVAQRLGLADDPADR
ncbi:MAG TPA: AAA family ATPase [Candidatus Limnocylindrales bacterium]|nr:AAA family ATPase [Candidatus Limnocylindrales bacterium]